MLILAAALIYVFYPFFNLFIHWLRPAQEIQTTDEDKVLHAVFLSVGQGDSMILKLGNWTAMVDTGMFEEAETLVSDLDLYGVDHLDAVFISHPHFDHMGSLQTVLKKYPVGTVYFADIPEELTPTANWYERALDVIGQKSVPLEVLHRGDVISAADGELTFTVHWSGGGKDLNDCSLVMTAEYGRNRILFMGDAEQDVERDLLSDGADLRADVLKVGHHGTKYATTSRFISAVRPSYAVISCGFDNEYGYPKEEVLERLLSAGSQIFRTDIQGNIHFVMDGKRIGCEAETPAEEGTAA